MSDCIFCAIAQKKIAARIVFENEHVLAFEDVSPQAPVHVLVIPKRHIASIDAIEDADTQTGERLTHAARECARLKGVVSSGYRVVINCGKDAGQAVNHLHYHVLGGRTFSWPPG